MDEERVIAEFERGPGQKIVVRHTRFRGKEYLDIRQFFEGMGVTGSPRRRAWPCPSSCERRSSRRSRRLRAS